MTRIIPFRGILYNREKITNLEDVVTPPYDVIPKEDYKKYYQRHGNNIIHIILGKDYPHDNDSYNKFTRAAGYFEGWIKDGIFKRDSLPSFYIYLQKYRIKNGEEKTRKGFIALVRLEEYEKRIVLPHEETFSKTKETLICLKRACNANLSPIFSLYSDPENEINHTIEKGISKNPPIIDIHDNDSTEHLLWRLSDIQEIDKIKELISDKQLIIADGHHRYETALGLRNILRREKGSSEPEMPFDYVMMYLTNMDDEGLSILPTHRIIQKLDRSNLRSLMDQLNKDFDVDTFDYEEKKRFFQALRQKGKEDISFGIFWGEERHYLLTLKNKDIMESYREDSRPREWWELDVTILQKLIIEEALGKRDSNEDNLIYTHDEEEAIRRVRDTKDSLALFLNPTKIEDLKKIVGLGEKMPQKSTYFFPKLLTGLVFNKLD